MSHSGSPIPWHVAARPGLPLMIVDGRGRVIADVHQSPADAALMAAAPALLDALRNLRERYVEVMHDERDLPGAEWCANDDDHAREAAVAIADALRVQP